MTDSRKNTIALVTGANGQDGYFLSKFLKRSGVKQVVGIVKPTSGAVACHKNKGNLRFYDEIVEIDLSDLPEISTFMLSLQPDYIFNFGAVASSLLQQTAPDKLFSINLNPVAAMLETIKENKLKTIFLQASSSEVFAGGIQSPQNFTTPRVPRTFYGATKIAADNLINIYRQYYGLQCYSLILFSHESPLRGPAFFTKKIVSQAFDVYEGKRKKVEIYSPDAMRDWGYAGEYCKGIVRSVITGKPEDLLVGSGVSTTVREFARTVFNKLGLNYETYAQEMPLPKGRANENLKVVVDKKSSHLCFNEGTKYTVDKLINLLIRYEKIVRKHSS